jgi:hypothetical protein
MAERVPSVRRGAVLPRGDGNSAWIDLAEDAQEGGYEPLLFVFGLRNERIEILGRVAVAIALGSVTHGTVMTAWLVSIGLVTDGFGFWVNLTQPDGWELSLESRQLHRVR